PAHDQRGKHAIVGELSAPRGLGTVEEWERLRRLAPDGPELKVSVPGPYTLAGRLLPNSRYLDRWAITEALLPLVRDELVERAERCLKFVPAERLLLAPDCGLSQTARWAARRKMEALVAGARLVSA